MSTKLFLIALTAFLGVSQFANAGVILWVNFGDDPTSPTENSLVRSYTPNGETTLTASYYLQIIGDSSIYAYRFSVKFSEKLALVDVDPITQTRPASFIPQRVQPALIDDLPDAADDGNNGIIKRISGIDPSVYDNVPGSLIEGEGFYKLATTTFKILKPLLPGDPLVTPGQFDTFVSTNDIAFYDIFDTDNGPSFFPQVNGGSVAISSIPEPTSALAFGVLGLVAAMARFNRRSKTKVS